MNEGIDKRLKKKKKKKGKAKRKKGKLEGDGRRKRKSFLPFFTSPGCREGKKVIENRLRKREEKRRWWSTIEKGSLGCC